MYKTHKCLTVNISYIHDYMIVYIITS